MNRRQIIGGAVIAAGAVAFLVNTWAGRPVTGTTLLDIVLFTLPIAGIYSLSATGLVVVYSTTGVFNFAQGAIGMFMAYFYWELRVHHGVPTIIALPLVVLVAAPLLGIALDRFIMRRLAGQPLVVQLVVTVGLMLSFMGLAATIWDQNSVHAIPTFFGTGGFHIGQVVDEVDRAGNEAQQRKAEDRQCQRHRVPKVRQDRVQVPSPELRREFGARRRACSASVITKVASTRWKNAGIQVENQRGAVFTVSPITIDFWYPTFARMREDGIDIRK